MEKFIKSCETCEFNFGNVCAGGGTRDDNGKSTYGMPMEEAEAMFPNGCDSWGISLSAYEMFDEDIEVEEAEEILKENSLKQNIH